MRFLEKIQKMSLPKRKAIFWMIVIIIGLIFLIVFILLTASRLKNFQSDSIKEDINFPSLESINSAFPDNSGEQEN